MKISWKGLHHHHHITTTTTTTTASTTSTTTIIIICFTTFVTLIYFIDLMIICYITNSIGIIRPGNTFYEEGIAILKVDSEFGPAFHTFELWMSVLKF